MANLVWYASYGSNLNCERFFCYIFGGRPPGSGRTNPGCRDRTPPLDRLPLSLSYELYFACHARAWGGGGVAFIRRGNQTATTLGRMYLITEDQFNDVVLQENSKAVDGTRILPPFEQLKCEKETLLPEAGWYARLLLVGKRDEYPIFTFTNARDDLKPSPPSEAYVKVIVAGIKETYPLMTDEHICEYLLRTDGIRGAIPPERLADWVARSAILVAER
jgi:hypothetical protein